MYETTDTTWDGKLAAIDAECNRNKILRAGPVLRAMLAMAELGI